MDFAWRLVLLRLFRIKHAQRTPQRKFRADIGMLVCGAAVLPVVLCREQHVAFSSFQFLKSAKRLKKLSGYVGLVNVFFVYHF